jgi:hypothetical protein
MATSLAFAAAASWEVASPLQGGHWASMAGCAIAAENMLRYHLFAAVAHYPAHPPPGPALYYCHHPYAIFLMEAAARLAFGHHDWVVRVPAIACSAATPFVVFRLGEALWGPLEGLVAAVGFVVVPVDLAFASFSSLEVPTILFGLVFCLGTVRAWQRGERGDIVLAALGALGACHSDWIGAVLVGLVLAFGVARRSRGRWWVACASVLFGTLALYAVLIAHAGQMKDLLGAFRLRSTAGDSYWATLTQPFRLERRLMRLQWMVPVVGFAVVAAALPVAVGRLRARPGEAVLLAWVAMATVHYLGFPLSAEVHVFWPHYYGPCVALALGTLASLAPRLRGAGRVGVWAALVVPIAMLARVAVVMLDQARLTQGRFDERGLHIESGAEATQFAAWATLGLPPDALVHCTHLCSWNVEYESGLAQVEGPLDVAPRSPEDRDRVELVDARYTPTARLRAIAAEHDPMAAGPLWRVDLAAPGRGRGVVAFREVDRQPQGLERFFVTDHDLVRTMLHEEDPWATWQWADALGTGGARAPPGEPHGLDQLAVAHNVARIDGDDAGASTLREKAMAQLDAPAAVAFSDDVHLLGTAVEHGAATVVTLLWETGPDFRATEDSTFEVRCRTSEPPRLWPVPLDPLDTEIAPPMTIQPSLWRAGRLYVQRFVWRRGTGRDGRERCAGHFVPATVRPLAARGELVELSGLR